MRDYLKDPEALPIPWVHSPFFHSLLEEGDYSESEKDTLRKFNKDGYAVVDLGLSDEEIHEVVSDMYTMKTTFSTLKAGESSSYGNRVRQPLNSA